MTLRKRFWSLVDTSAGPFSCWPWLGRVDRDGYGLFGRSSRRANRIAFELGRGQVLMPWAVVRHTCDKPPCCNPLHLISGSQALNVADRVARNRSAAGHRNGRSVLGAAAVLQICFLPGSYRAKARQFGVDHTTVRDIRSGRIWGWLTGVNSHAPRFVPTRGPNDSGTDAVSR